MHRKFTAACWKPASRVVAVGTVAALALAACQKKDEATAKGDAAPDAAGASAALPADPAQFKRRPGLWSQAMTSDGSTQTIKLCTDEATEAKFSLVGQQVSKEMCPKNVITPKPGGWAFESECSMGGMGTTVTRGEATGDLNSRYTIKATVVTSGSSMPQANGTSQMEITAVREGDCPAGMKPGDMTLPGGITMNLNSIPTGK
ncbi:DUF3617 family protein [Phenylobacterium sp.]|uniref:DUF3617 domain-containing protein n=1 Tax=Phenylobacterium sp. TaxID=1871053 RepID=UPI00301C26AD